MDSKEFVASLVDEMAALFRQLGAQETLEAESEGQLEVISLLRLALKSELEASELAAHWMPTTPEIEAKKLFAEQCGDEMKHYELIQRRLEELGVGRESFDVLEDGYSPLYHYLRGLRTTVERIAAGPFVCEAVATVRNRQFMDFCRSVGDEATAKLYAEIIQPEEFHHHEMARKLLEKYCISPELQELAATAAHSSLAVADELRTLKEKTTGFHAIPVS
jgi:1,2-phenylacetyl-CoA epoxidase catalytic subunit